MIYVMSDIHGMYNKYKKMLKKIKFNENDTLYILGDMVDRGKNSFKILKDMMIHKNIYGLIGNHELMFLEAIKVLNQEINDDFIHQLSIDDLGIVSLWLENGGKETLNEWKQLTNDEKLNILDYLQELSLYEEIKIKDKHYIMVHAGIDHFSENTPLENYHYQDFLWERPDFNKPYYQDKSKYVIVGHTPTLAISGKASIYRQNNIIAIDCGACFPGGKLACLCLDTNEEFYI